MSTHGSLGVDVAIAPSRPQRLALAFHFWWLLAFTLGCENSAAPKTLSMDVLPGYYEGIGTGNYYYPPGPRLLYESPSLKVEAVSASVMIASNLTYTLNAVYRVTRATGVATVEWKSDGEIRPRLPSDGGLPSDDQHLLIELVENGLSMSALRGLYAAPVCMSGFGLSISIDHPCVNMPATMYISGVIPRILIPDGPDIAFAYNMNRG